MKKPLLFVLPMLAIGLVSCSDDDPAKAIEYETITFEDCEFPEGKLTNIVTSSTGSTGEYVELGAKFAFKDMYSMDGGDVVSSQAAISESGTPKANAVALPADTEHPGADGSDKFVVLNKNSSSLFNDFPPEFSFESGVERQIVSLDLMNSTMMYQYMKYGFYSYAPLAAGDWCEVTFTGYDAEGAETGTVTVAVGDYRDGKEYIMEEWTTVDLTPLGKVNKVAVAMNWSDTWNKPSSGNWAVCADNIKMIKEETAE